MVASQMRVLQKGVECAGVRKLAEVKGNSRSEGNSIVAALNRSVGASSGIEAERLVVVVIEPTVPPVPFPSTGIAW
ncbi:hypothetical protein ABIE38_001946 [Dietzia sp. 2505]